MSVETRWWHTERGKVVCTLCPRECHIPEGSRGFCFVRANVDGHLELTTDGRSSGFCIDPIEKKPLNHFLPGTPVMSFGTAGCNLGCKFCQNWDISKSREMDRLADRGDPESIIEAAKRTGCRSVAFTYNDPVIWAEYAIEIAKIARREGIKTVAVTAGYISPEPRIEFYKWMDAANVDLKAFTETFYRKLTQTHLEPVLETLKYLKHETDVWFEITNLMIPGENDSTEEIERMCDWFVENLGDQVPVHFTAFHPDFKMRDKPRTPHETLIRARQQAIDAGIKYAYVGNVYDLRHQSTYCPNCGGIVIERDWYELGRYNLDHSRCAACGHAVPGVFERARGNWGRKRVPVTIESAPETLKVTARPRRRRLSNTTAVGHEASTAHTRTGSATITRSANPDPPGATAPGKADGTATPSASPHNPPPPKIPEAASDPPDRLKIDFDDDQVRAILAHARAVVEATARGEATDFELPADVAGSKSYGIFVTLRRPAQMRSCRGRWGGDRLFDLDSLLTSVTADSARSDSRFPRIDPKELPWLAIDVSLMFNPQQVTATGEDRIQAVEAGRHGLVIDHPRGRGLLLPHVATEADWDTKAFLDGVCRKAKLPPDTWRRDNTSRILTFEARRVSSEAPKRELDPLTLTGQRIQELLAAANEMLFGHFDDAGAHEALRESHEEELAMFLQTGSGLNTTAVGTGQSLLQLTAAAVNSLKELCVSKGRQTERISRATLLWQAIPLSAADYPDRHRGLVNHAVLARRNGPWSLVVPGQNARSDRVGTVLANLNITPEGWQMNENLRVTAFSTIGFAARQSPNTSHIRRPARDGQFYPADPDTMNRNIDNYLAAANGGDKTVRRAIMLPHAGWTYCGETIGKTLRRAVVPDTVIIIGPKHTPDGESCSIAPHEAWDIPGARVPIARELADYLIGQTSNPRLHSEPEAHRMEHGSEVLIPFLHRLNPALRVVPIVIGRTDYESTAPLAAALAELYRRAENKPLLVISSDMNHFASEPENRHRDFMALDAMRTGDPRKLYDTCIKHDISMCGFVPACIIMQALLNLTPVLEPELVDYSNSAKASGDTSRVVGYAGVLFD